MTQALEESRAVTGVSVQVSCTGLIQDAVEITSVYGMDLQSSEAVGLIGEPVEIQCNQAFDQAEITFHYNPDELGSAKEEDLRVMWYDEENDRYVIMDDESVLDPVSHTVSYQTTHFSTNLLVDRYAWYWVWKTLLLRFLPGVEENNLFIWLDASAGMDEAAYLRQEAAVKQIADGMGEEERAFLFCDDVLLEDSFRPLTGTELKRKVEEATRLLVQSPGLRRDQEMNDIMRDTLHYLPQIFVESDVIVSQVLVFSSGTIAPMYSHIECRYVDDMNRMGAQFHTIKIADRNDNGFLNYLTEINGNKGSYQELAGAGNLDVSVYFPERNPEEIPPVDTTDTDGDGLYDCYESGGMVLPNGQMVYSNPYNPDSDGDGLSDYEEMGGASVFINPYTMEEVPEESTVYIMGSVVERSVPKFPVKVPVFKFASNVWEQDTDGDGIVDFMDLRPVKYDACVDQINEDYIKFNTGRTWYRVKCTVKQFYDSMNYGPRKAGITVEEYNKAWECIVNNYEQDFNREELYCIVSNNIEGARFYLDYESDATRKAIYKEITREKEVYYRYDHGKNCYVEEDSYKKGGFFKGKIISNYDIDLSTRAYTFYDFDDVLKCVLQMGTVLITSVLAVELTPIVIANLSALNYYCKKFGIKDGYQMYRYLGTEALKEYSVLAWMQTEHKKDQARKLFINGGLYEESIQVNGITIDVVAEVEINGNFLVLRDICIYARQGDMPNSVGMVFFKTMLKRIVAQAKLAGYSTLRIVGQRALHSTSANPGMLIDKIINLK